MKFMVAFAVLISLIAMFLTVIFECKSRERVTVEKAGIEELIKDMRALHK